MAGFWQSQPGSVAWSSSSSRLRMRSAVQRFRSTSRAQPRSVASAMSCSSVRSRSSSRYVLRCGDELRAGQVQVALTRAFLGQAQAAAELKLGLVEVGLEQVQGALVELAAAQGIGQRTGDRRAGLQDGLVVGEHDPLIPLVPYLSQSEMCE